MRSNRNLGRMLALYPVLLWTWMAWACAGEWLHNPNYQYGFLMLPLAAYFFIKRMGDFGFPEKVSFSPVGWCILLFAACLVLPVELLRLSPLYWRLLPWIIGMMAASATFGVARILGGSPLMRVVAFPVAFLLLAIPWPTIIEQATTLPLMNLVAGIVGQGALFSGIPASVSGSVITLPNCIVGIEEACSGLRSFQTALVISLAAGEIYHLTLRRRVLLFAFAALAAFLGNIIRTFILTWAGYHGGTMQIDRVHDFAAWGFLLLLVMGIFAFAIFLRPRFQGPGRTFAARKKSPAVISPASLGVLWIIGIGGFLLAQGWYASHAAQNKSDFRPVLSDEAKRNPQIETLEVPTEVRNILSPNSGKYFRTDNGGKLPLSAYHFFWEPSRTTAFQVYHRPDICMPGAGWKQTGPVTQMEIPAEGAPLSWYVFPYERDHVRAFLLWSAWMDGQPMKFEFDRKLPVQRSVALRFIANGKRKVAYEVAAILIPCEDSALPEDLAKEAVRQFFSTHENSPGR